MVVAGVGIDLFAPASERESEREGAAKDHLVSIVDAAVVGDHHDLVIGVLHVDGLGCEGVAVLEEDDPVGTLGDEMVAMVMNGLNGEGK